jgi:UDP-2-acetamido-2,6-beta-L-arabino-hexul-4-ose reductase
VRVAITGAAGLLGWHIRCALHSAGIETVPIGRPEFGDGRQLLAALDGCEAVVHAAGANRGEDAEVEQTNVKLAADLAEAIAGESVPPLIVYLNSTQHLNDTPYGRSKRVAASVLGESGAPFLDLVLPGVFGEFGRPFYNSVVSTFCHQLSKGEQLTIHNDAPVEVVHAQDVADIVVSRLREGQVGQERVEGAHLSVRELAEQLGDLHARYEDGVVPFVSDPLQRALFNTLRSYRFPGRYPTVLSPRSDNRGRLVELSKADTGGQTFISTTAPGITRGQHYHRRKLERFVVVEGQATISLRRMFGGEVISFEVRGEDPVAIDMPTLVTHNITNSGGDTLVTVFWTDEIFNPEAPDTYAEAV